MTFGTGLKPQYKKIAHRGEYVATIIANIAFLVVFNNLRNWGVEFLTAEFDSLLWLFNLSAGATIVANSVYLAYGYEWFKAATKTVINSISLIWLYRLYQAFPFNFSSASMPVIDFSWDTIAKMVLILAMIGTGIAILVEFIRWVGAVTGNGQSKP